MSAKREVWVVEKDGVPHGLHFGEGDARSGRAGPSPDEPGVGVVRYTPAIEWTAFDEENPPADGYHDRLVVGKATQGRVPPDAPFVAHYSFGMGCWFNGQAVEVTVTHYMPLPKPPEGA